MIDLLYILERQFPGGDQNERLNGIDGWIEAASRLAEMQIRIAARNLLKDGKLSAYPNILIV